MSTNIFTNGNDMFTRINTMDYFRQYVEERIQELGISQNQVAKNAGMSGAWLSRYLTGERSSMKIDAFIKLATALKVHPADLILAYQGKNPKEAYKDEPFPNKDSELYEAFKLFMKWKKSE